METVLDIPGERPDELGLALLVAPETVLDGPAEVVLDARGARRLDTATPQRSEDRQRKLDYQVEYADGSTFRDAYQIPVKYDDLYVSPTEKVTQGSFTLVSRWRKGEPTLSLRAFGLLPIEATLQPGSALTAGADRLRAVYAGSGAASEYANLDAKGKIAVVTRSDTVSAAERTAAAVAAGASLLLVVNEHESFNLASRPSGDRTGPRRRHPACDHTHNALGWIRAPMPRVDTARGVVADHHHGVGRHRRRRGADTGRHRLPRQCRHALHLHVAAGFPPDPRDADTDLDCGRVEHHQVAVSEMTQAPPPHQQAVTLVQGRLHAVTLDRNDE